MLIDARNVQWRDLKGHFQDYSLGAIFERIENDSSAQEALKADKPAIQQLFEQFFPEVEDKSSLRSFRKLAAMRLNSSLLEHIDPLNTERSLDTNPVTFENEPLKTHRSYMHSLESIYSSRDLPTLLKMAGSQDIACERREALVKAIIEHLTNTDGTFEAENISFEGRVVLVPAIVEAMHKFEGTITISLKSCAVSDTHIALLAPLISDGKIGSLSLSDNAITAAGLASIAEAAKSDNSKLVTLNLANNAITDDAIETLTAWLPDAAICLDLSGNSISSEALAQVTKHDYCDVTV